MRKITLFAKRVFWMGVLVAWLALLWIFKWYVIAFIIVYGIAASIYEKKTGKTLQLKALFKRDKR